EKSELEGVVSVSLLWLNKTTVFVFALNWVGRYGWGVVVKISYMGRVYLTRFLKWVGGRGLLKLYNDVQSCGYQDVQVMWEMLQNSETTSSPKRQRSAWKICIWAAHP
ncbi:hypothetical protein KI387_037254, partial [Taxus chinensis]